MLETDQADVWLKLGIGLEKKVSNEKDICIHFMIQSDDSFSTRLKNLTNSVEPLKPLKI